MTTTTHRAATKKPATKKKSAHAKPAPKVRSKKNGGPTKLATQALKILDEAAVLLRTGIQEGTQTTERTRILAKKKAHSLLGKASRTLSHAIEDGTSTLQKIIKKM
jgi:uncharacterized protein HemX